MFVTPRSMSRYRSGREESWAARLGEPSLSLESSCGRALAPDEGWEADGWQGRERLTHRGDISSVMHDHTSQPAGFLSDSEVLGTVVCQALTSGTPWDLFFFFFFSSLLNAEKAVLCIRFLSERRIIFLLQNVQRGKFQGLLCMRGEILWGGFFFFTFFAICLTIIFYIRHCQLSADTQIYISSFSVWWHLTPAIKTTDY